MICSAREGLILDTSPSLCKLASESDCEVLTAHNMHQNMHMQYNASMKLESNKNKSCGRTVCLNSALLLKTLTKNFNINFFSESVTLTSRPLMLVRMVQHRTSGQYLKSGQE